MRHFSEQPNSFGEHILRLDLSFSEMKIGTALITRRAFGD
jgi:hypothetical protein